MNQCQSCQHWKPIPFMDMTRSDREEYGDKRIGDCTRFPPTLACYQPPSPNETPLAYYHNHTRFPITLNTESCGEYQQSPQSAHEERSKYVQPT